MARKRYPQVPRINLVTLISHLSEEIDLQLMKVNTMEALRLPETKMVLVNTKNSMSSRMELFTKVKSG